MGGFPIFLDLKDRTALVVGATAVAARKAKALRHAGAQIRIVAPELDPAFAALLDDERPEHLPEAFVPDHLSGAVLVVAADADPAINEKVSRAAQARSLPVNVVDRPDLCTFVWPAIVDRSPVMVAISTGGAAPVLARLIRSRIESLLPDGVGMLARLAAAFRPLAARALKDARTRRRFWETVLEGRVADLVFAGRREAAQRALVATLARAADREARSPLDARPGVLDAVTVAADDPDSLTLRALRLLQCADVIVHDDTISPAVLERGRRDADRIALDPKRGAPSRMLAMLAHGGRRVVLIQALAAASHGAAAEIARRGTGDAQRLRLAQSG